MKLSIIIPVYNVEKYIAYCLDSLLNQNLRGDEYEILIIDDGSKDNSVLIARNYLDKNKNIHIHSQKNAGVGCARNTGLDLAKGEYIYFIDPDDYLAANILGEILNKCYENSLDILTFNSKSTISSKMYNSTSKNEDLIISKVMSGEDYIGEYGYANEVWWYIIKKELVSKLRLRFIKGRWMEDAIFTINIFLGANCMAHLPIDAHRHVKAPGSAMTNRDREHFLKVIFDNENAAKTFKPIIDKLESNKSNIKCLKFVKSRQQSFVFFMLYRMLFSHIKKDQMNSVFCNMKEIGAYPLNSFLGDRYKGLHYYICVKIFNNRFLYSLVFKLLNPILRSN
ncbi:glycosyltransferase [Algibacter mikhailovii]|uniref:Glycosyltransferase 2-like domain-containing protein n=1 Tax=Algibacter mikhailovii TaxID=425498 RepID=A0A918V5W3_9FLAO|nr:glycosyltransferase [Algibacter mikhailovii]GGZ68874.1 hypothetical protein GCM10007028_02260 [Algibacter mikhailovii]